MQNYPVNKSHKVSNT